jgi:hypothetical protein
MSTSIPSALELRDLLKTMVEKELLGPAGSEEEDIVEGTVRSRYILGLLAPKGQSLIVDEQDNLADDEQDTLEEGEADAAPAPVASLLPSSIGLTFSVQKDAEAIHVRARWGHYYRTESDYLTKDTGAPQLVWKREQIDVSSEPVALKSGKLGPWSPHPEHPEVVVKGLIREYSDAWTITLYLVNGQIEPNQRKDEAWVFQPELAVSHPEGLAIFIKRYLPEQFHTNDLEDRRMEMNYRRHLEFVVGHGVGAHADLAPNRWDRAVKVETRVLPAHEVLRMEAPTAEDIPGLKDLRLDMKTLSELEMGTYQAALSPLLTAYEDWISEREGERGKDLEPYQEDAADALSACRQNLARIAEGIRLLDQNADAARSFRFANRAMADQRIHTIYTRAVRQGKEISLEDIDTPANRSWRPFQLAFLLMTLPEMADPSHPKRSDPSQALVDLLWFPTGGGKTEAYLGAAAFTMAMRRLQKDPDWPSGQAGVTVLMRYTLRLLTLQQFQRAAALMCACELIRQEDADTWGEEPFRIGLWVGERSSPNWTKHAKEIIDQQRGQYQGSTIAGKGTPAQLTNCPWCGEPIRPGIDIHVELYGQGRGRTLQYCSDKYGNCPFSRKKAPDEGLPIVVVDEEIYRLLPALVIATVDKFAQMPWKGPVQMLFGRINGKCPRHGYRSPDLEDTDRHNAAGGLPAVKTTPMPPLRPPDLIIQDELHLISGPLGTLVGLYETAIDYLCEWQAGGKTIKPKIIASTATIRRSENQVHQLYLRKVNIFPPSGLNTEDNFFSRQVLSTEQYPGRLYLGICAPGARLKTALLRVYMAYMAAAQQLFNDYGVLADPWMTTVGYFNAMRELGGMRRIIDDSLRSILSKANWRGFPNRYISPFSVEELNSRRSGVDIPKILDRLETRFDPQQKEKRDSEIIKEKKPSSQYPLDIVLCTNMISVGVDISRLGLMIVAGQPKTTAEYIQASSRVGRSFPGIVCTVFYWSRPRDLSHYERFEHYHDTFYQHVEALSVTPFSPRAMDRGLTGTFVSMLRLQNEDLNAEASAHEFSRASKGLEEIQKAVQDRAERVTDDIESSELAHDMLEERVDQWINKTSKPPVHLTYSTKKGNQLPLLSQPDKKDRSLFTCLNSLRDVEQTVNLILTVYDDKDEEGGGDE